MKKSLSLALLLGSALPLFADAPGNALDFDGSNDYVNIPHSDSLDLDVMTVETWFRSDMEGTFFRALVAKYGTSGETSASWGLGWMAGNTLGFYIRDASKDIDSVQAPQDWGLDNRWHHIAATVGTDSVKLYLDGKVARSIARTLGTDSFKNTKAVTLAHHYGSYANASMDETRIWSVVRTADEIQESMDTTLAGSETGLVAYYDFDTGTAGGSNTGETSLADQSSIGNIGTLYSFALSGNSSNWVESYAMVMPRAGEATDATDTSFTLNWTAPRVGTVDSYILTVATDSALTDTLEGHGSDTLSGDSLSYPVSGLDIASNYYWRIIPQKTGLEGQGIPVVTVQSTLFPDAPVISLADTLTFAENADAAHVDTAASVDYSRSWEGGSLVAQIASNAEDSDFLGIDTSGALSVEGDSLLNGNSVVAYLENGVSVSAGTALSMQFTDGVGTDVVELVLQSLLYQNTSEAPDTSAKTLRVTATDQYGSAGTDSCVVLVQAENDTPVRVTQDTIDYARDSDTLTTDDLRFTDSDTPDSGLVYTLVSVSGDGALSLSNTTLAASGTFTQEDIDSGRVTLAITRQNYAKLDSLVLTLTDGVDTLAVVLYLNVGYFAGGSGTAADPFQITTTTELDHVRQMLDTNYILMNDLEFTDADFAAGGDFYNSGSGWEPIGENNSAPFTGTFNGKGHVVKGLYINRSSTSYVGLFGFAYGAGIDSLGLQDVAISGKDYVGGITGVNHYSTISNSYSTGSITGSGDYVGGIAGVNYYSSISNSYCTGNITGNEISVGGITGQNGASTISGCYSTGNVTGNGYNVGGITGYSSYSSSISYSYSTGNITGNGIYTGGVAGYNVNSTISYSYATGRVSGDSLVGGIVGYDTSSTITACFWDTEASGIDSAFGYESNSQSASGLSTAAMKLAASFSAWGLDTSTTWGIEEGLSYPALKTVGDNAPFAFADTLTLGAPAAILANDYDYETVQANLVVALDDSGYTVKDGKLYRPADAVAGTLDTLTYRVGEVRDSDTLWGNQAYVYITIAANTAPAFATDTLNAVEDSALSVALTSLATDAEGDGLTFSLPTNASDGTATLSEDSLTYTPDSDFTGLDSLRLTVSDGELSDTAWIYINVTAVNDAPVLTAVDTGLSMLQGDTLTLDMDDVTATDVDNDSGDLSLVIYSGDDYSVDGASITASSSYAGTLSVAVAVTDGQDTSNVDTLSITVTQAASSSSSTAASSSSSDAGSSSSAATESSSSSEGPTFTVAGTNSQSAQLNIRSASGTLDISYTIPRSGNVDIAFYNVLGMKAHELHQGPQAVGTHNALGRVDLPAGRYIAVLRLNGVTQDRSSWIMH